MNDEFDAFCPFERVSFGSVICLCGQGQASEGQGRRLNPRALPRDEQKTIKIARMRESSNGHDGNPDFVE